MSITLKISNEQMKEPGVAEALANLMTALGGSSRRLPTPVTQSVEASPKKRRGRPPKDKSAAPKPQVTNINSLEELKEQVSDQSRRFLELLEERQTLQMPEVMQELGLNHKKAVGGVVGGIARKATKYGLYCPFQSGKNDEGVRVWKWTGDVHTKPAPLTFPKTNKRSSGRPRKNAANTGPKKGHPRVRKS